MMNDIMELERMPIRETMDQVEIEKVAVDESFSYEGYQVVRGEFFAHLFEPSITINKEKVAVNAACIRKLPEVEYVQFLVNPEEKKLAVKPCSEEMKDSFCWATIDSKGKYKPKSISCKIFFAKVMKLMNWNPEFRYKILGKLIRTSTDMLFVFDLTCAETYGKKNATDTGRRAYYPEEWSNQFGLPVSEHQGKVLVNIFDEYTVFKIEREEEAAEDVIVETDGEVDKESEEHADSAYD